MSEIPNSSRRGVGVAIVLLAGQTMAGVDTAIINVATPAIRASLGATDKELILVASGYVLAYAVLLQVGARLGDAFGYASTFRTGLILFTAASLACGAAPNAVALIIARILQGGGAALMVPQVLVGIQREYHGPARDRALGLYSFALAGSAVLGQVLGGTLVTANVSGTGWRAIFFINIPIGLGALIASRKFLPDRGSGASAEPVAIDIPGAALLTFSLSLIVVPLVFAPDLGWPLWALISLVASVPAAAIFVLFERSVLRTSRRLPLLNVRLVARPTIAWALVANVTAASGYFALLFILALHLQQVVGHSALYSGLILIPWVVAFGVVAPPIARRISRKTLMTVPVGYSLLSVSHASLVASMLFGIYDGALLLIVLGAGGLGLGIGFTGLLTHLTTVVPEESAADLSGLLNTSSQLAGAIGVATFGTAYLTMSSGSVASSSDAFAFVAATMTGVAALAALCGHLSMRAAHREISSVGG